MSKRKIISIDESKCNGCGQCIPNCPEGAIQLIDGKARLISDIFCDGLGACVGNCPLGAITTIEREAEAYDEDKVMENIVKQGENVIIAHLKHLKDHDERELLKQAIDFLERSGVQVNWASDTKKECAFTCPGTKMVDLRANKKSTGKNPDMDEFSELGQWPVQLKLVSPNAPYFKMSDFVLTADCVAYALGGFHTRYLKGKTIAIACPKLDTDKQSYLEKLISLINEAKINTMTVMIMEVPCCKGLQQLAESAVSAAERKIPLKTIVVGIKGDILSENWVAV